MELVGWIQTVVLAGTLVVVLLYTVETSKLRREMVRQNEISLRPIVLPDFQIQGNVRTFRLRNCGVGCALNVQVSPVRIPDALTQGLGFGQCEIRFEPAYYMASQEHLAIPFSVWADGQHVPNSPLNHWFFPDRATRRISFGIRFQDVEGRSYRVPITIEGAAEQLGIPKRVAVGPLQRTRS